jgi:hypothetical protein
MQEEGNSRSISQLREGRIILQEFSLYRPSNAIYPELLKNILSKANENVSKEMKSSAISANLNLQIDTT